MFKPLTLIPSIGLTALILFVGAIAAATVTAGAQANVDSEQVDQVVSDSQGLDGGLQIQLQGVRNDKGRIIVMVFDQAQAYSSYDYTKALGYQEPAALKGDMNLTFPDLVDGPYAVVVTHDENQDYVLNEANGYPVEGYATSGAKGKYHTPTFKEAAIVEDHIKLEMFYF